MGQENTFEGIALQHPTPGDLSVEVHVVLDERFLNYSFSQM